MLFNHTMFLFKFHAIKCNVNINQLVDKKTT